MEKFPYSNAIGSVMYLMVSTRPNIAYVVSLQGPGDGNDDYLDPIPLDLVQGCSKRNKSKHKASRRNPGHIEMPTVAGRRSSLAADPSAEIGVAATPKKGRLRSDNAITESPMRKSPRFCTQGSPNSPVKVNVEKCVKTLKNFSRSAQEKKLSENLLEKQIWDPRGTGKSLSMEKVKETLVNWANEEDIHPPDILTINCTSLTNTTEIFSKILGQSHPQKKLDRSSSSLQVLRNMYSQKQPLGTKMILVIADELDYLIAKDRAVLHDLFMLTTMPFSKCILLGIANAIDLADRFIPKLQSLNCKPMVITFRAYSKDQIMRILQERLRELPYSVFQPQALELCARRVAAASGDMRKALSVCRSAIEMLEAERRDPISNLSLSLLERIEDQQKPAACDTVKNQLNNMVRIDHVAAALSKTFKSPVVDTIQSLPQHQQIILCSAVKLFRGGKKDTTIGELNKFYVDVCKSTLIPPVGIVELASMCRVLDDQRHQLQGILKLGQSREDKLKRVALKVDGADIAFALQTEIKLVNHIILYMDQHSKTTENIHNVKLLQLLKNKPCTELPTEGHSKNEISQETRSAAQSFPRS
ncbi:Cell division control protein 6B [Sesamum angolense]|uniref:Cell division control protein 6B n=1 Tax=Sesamum angolense TaxID=2727404 RepID=A0AAE1WM76_9LAMI|nr:Cell division control protein 6B [Sesamum angolense]